MIRESMLGVLGGPKEGKTGVLRAQTSHMEQYLLNQSSRVPVVIHVFSTIFSFRVSCNVSCTNVVSRCCLVLALPLICLQTIAAQSLLVAQTDLIITRHCRYDKALCGSCIIVLAAMTHC